MKHFKKELSPIKIFINNKIIGSGFSTSRLCDKVYDFEYNVSSDIDEVTCKKCIRLYKLKLFI